MPPSDEPNDLLAYLKAHPPDPGRPFVPFAAYHEVDDRLEVYWSGAGAYATSVTPELTVMRDLKTKEVIGVKVYGVKGKVADPATRWPNAGAAQTALEGH